MRGVFENGRPHVAHPLALAWVGDTLLVVTRAGELWALEPSGGRRRVADGLGVCRVLAVHDDGERYLVASPSGRWTVGTLAGEEVSTGRHPHTSNLLGHFADDFVVLFGDAPGGERSLTVFDGAECVLHVVLPELVHARYAGEGSWVLVRSLQSGLQQLPLQDFLRTGRFEVPTGVEPTGHRLRVVGEHVLGWSDVGACVWSLAAGDPRTVRLSDLGCVDFSASHDCFAAGTQHGAVALAHFADPVARTRPALIRAFDSAVRCLALAPSRRWLATGAETLRIWSWEDGS